jgi:hypothetical protein
VPPVAAGLPSGPAARVRVRAVGHGRYGEVGGWAAFLELAVSGYGTAIGYERDGDEVGARGVIFLCRAAVYRSRAAAGTVFLAAGLKEDHRFDGQPTCRMGVFRLGP